MTKTTWLPAAHPNVPAVDQSDRTVPRNLRQSGATPVEMLVSTRVRKSPFWHLSHASGCWRATVYNRMYHPRGYVRPEEGGAEAEYQALVERVTLWDVAVERQIQVKGPEAEAFVDFVITREAKSIRPMHAKYCLLCNERGGILNDPVTLRLAEDEFWFSISDSDLMLWLQGVNLGRRFEVDIAETDVAPLQVQGPLSDGLMGELAGREVTELPYYGLAECEIGGVPVVVSKTGFSGESGYEIYVRDASKHAERVWHAVHAAGASYGLAVIAPSHERRIAAGIFSWGQDIDAETSPLQAGLDYQVPRDKAGDYVGRAALERQRAAIEAGEAPFALGLVGLSLGGRPITDYAPDFWLVHEPGGQPVGYLTSAWHSPERGGNIALGYVPWAMRAPGTAFEVALPTLLREGQGPVAAEVSELPFRRSQHPGAREQQEKSGAA